MNLTQLHVAALLFSGDPVWRSRGGLGTSTHTGLTVKATPTAATPGARMPPSCRNLESFLNTMTNTSSKSIQLPQICLRKRNRLKPSWDPQNVLILNQFDILLFSSSMGGSRRIISRSQTCEWHKTEADCASVFLTLVCIFSAEHLECAQRQQTVLEFNKIAWLNQAQGEHRTHTGLPAAWNLFFPSHNESFCSNLKPHHLISVWSSSRNT